MFLVNFIFVVSNLKIHLAVHLNTSKNLTSLLFIKGLLAFAIAMF